MKKKQIKITKKVLSFIVLYAFVLNFFWEMLQMPFYENMNWDLQSTLYCFAASIGDVFMTLVIFFTVGYLTKLRMKWIEKLNFKNIIITLSTGLYLSIIVEQFALRLSMWSYTDLMPELPFLNIGIVPILQMLILPLLVFYLSRLTVDFKID